MKASVVLNIALAVVLVILSVKLIEKDDAPQTSATEEYAKEAEASTGEFQSYDVQEDFQTNPFTYFLGDGLLLTAGDSTGSNAMTIGWGALGTLWGRNIITVYVRENRHTHQFMEKGEYFTIMTFSDKQVLDYMGTKSGRDGDKAKALGLHTHYTENGAPYYEEADEVIECRTMYSHTFTREDFRNEVPQQFYETHAEGGFHTEYTGEVVGMMRKK